MPPILILIPIVVLIMVMVIEEMAFRKKWPPISDDEFVRRCSPGTNRETALKVRRIIADQLGVDYERVYPEQSFVEDLGAD